MGSKNLMIASFNAGFAEKREKVFAIQAKHIAEENHRKAVRLNAQTMRELAHDCLGARTFMQNKAKIIDRCWAFARQGGDAYNKGLETLKWASTGRKSWEEAVKVFVS